MITDLQTAFCRLSRSAIEHRVQAVMPRLLRLVQFLYGQPTNIDITCPFSSTIFTFQQEQGVIQGNPFSTMLFAGAYGAAVNDVMGRHPGISAIGLTDDYLFYGPVASLSAFVVDLEASGNPHGAVYNRPKLRIFAREGNSADVITLRDALGIPQPANAEADGLVFGGVPHGTPEFVQAQLRKHVDD
jgi:hypothetical protein